VKEDESILAVAGDVGLDATRLEPDRANPEWQTAIDCDRALAKDLGISGTPGCIVGTELVPGALAVNGLQEFVATSQDGK
jgi:predicted DsbA family dithiol-disulfide isomerase